MKQLVVVSGKGGTGKTSLVASFVSLAGRCVVCDCDVDAANLHILLQPEDTGGEDFYALETARIDSFRCTRCGLCETSCRFGAISDYAVDPLKCEGCGVCELVCPVGAIESFGRAVGKIFWSKTKYGPFFHGALRPGGSNAGRMVSEIRERSIAELEKWEGRDSESLVLIDGPPGIGCPATSSMVRTDMALVVAEPTLSSLHDLERVLVLGEQLDARSFVVVNKCDLNRTQTKRIESLCRSHGIAVLGRIPYDPEVVRAMVAARPVVEFGDGEAAKAMRLVWSRVLSVLRPQASVV